MQTAAGPMACRPTRPRPWCGELRLGQNLLNGFLERFDGLRASQQIAVVEDNRGDGIDAHRLVLLFFCTNLIGIVVPLQNSARGDTVESRGFHRFHQNVMAAGRFALAVISLQQRLF